MSGGFEALAQCPVVVDLTVADDDHGSIFVADRLMTASHIDDGEATHPEQKLRFAERPFIVRSAVSDRSTHALQHRGIVMPQAAQSEDAVDSAHERLLSAQISRDRRTD